MLNNNTAATEKQLQDERQGKMLLHTEFSLLSLLKNEPGVIQQHGMFSVSIKIEAISLGVALNSECNVNHFYRTQHLKRWQLMLSVITAITRETHENG